MECEKVIKKLLTEMAVWLYDNSNKGVLHTGIAPFSFVHDAQGRERKPADYAAGALRGRAEGKELSFA